MGKRDDFLDYNTSRRNRDRRDGRRRRGYNLWKVTAFFIIVLLVFAAGGAAYFISLKLFNKASGKEAEGSYILYTGGTSFNSEVPGAYGIGQLFEAPEGIYDNSKVQPSSDISDDAAAFVDMRTPVKAKGLYVTFEGVTKLFDSITGLIDRTELNTIIIDVKDDEGRLTFSMEGELISSYGTSRNYISDIKETVKKLKDLDIYVIARVVSFRDPLLGEKRPDLLLHNNDGSIYEDYSGYVWLNPFKAEVLDYLVEIARNCAEAGFNEVNFDYIRYPTDGRISEIDLSEGGDEKTKIDAVTEAVKYLCDKIKPLGLYVSADVFGGIITSAPDQRNVGQDYLELSKYLDYICPMIYPSHYGNGYYGVDYPDTKPYIIVYRALLDSQKVLSAIDEEVDKKAVVRPWLQDFTASYLKRYIVYGSEEVRTQIDAVYDAGYEEWFLWNASMNYTEKALMTEAEADEAYRNRPVPTEVPVSEKAAENEAAKKKDTGQYYDSPWKAE